ncbi:YfiR/HmsC family protein [Roseomonas elaeocarpi]|uniref:YfiR/HmsC family protein n=1 Tax=Roseomonas elaeocarpi TaxID=907779 RepID=A0ABV6JVS7_9PROT
MPRPVPERPRRTASRRLPAGRRRLLALAVAITLLPGREAGAADTTPRDLQLIGQVLGFLEHPPTGAVEVGLLYAPAARVEAEQLAQRFGDGVRAGGVTLRPRLLPVAEIGTAAPRVLLLTNSALPEAAAVARAVAGRGIMTVSPDPALIDGGLAVLAVRSSPRVEILVSRAAAQSAGLSFAGAFRMMIQER